MKQRKHQTERNKGKKEGRGRVGGGGGGTPGRRDL